MGIAERKQSKRLICAKDSSIMAERWGFTRHAIAVNVHAMEELLRSNDLVYLSFVRHVLAEEGIDFVQLDDHMSAMEGSVGILPRRIMVASDLLPRAKLALSNASLTIGN